MEKIKHFIEGDQGKDILVIIIIILVGLGSFELGRLSKNSSNPGIKVEYSDQEANTTAPMGQNEANLAQNSNSVQFTQKSQSSSGGGFFASSKGSKYYTLSCSAGKNIKQENRIYFETSTEAEKAGYVLSSSCK